MALDPFAVATGAQLGQNIWNQEQTAQNTQLQNALKMPGQLDAYSDQADQRTAASYMVPMLNDMQSADGSDLDYMLNKRQQVLGDPAYHAMTPRAQSYVLQHLGSAATQTASQYVNSGQLDAAHKLFTGFHLDGVMDPLAQTRQSGDLVAIVKAYNDRFGSNMKLSPDGKTVEMTNRQVIPTVDVANAILRGGPNAGTELTTMGAASNAADENRKLQQAQLRMEQERQLGIQGFMKQPDGSWLNPKFGTTQPALPESIYGPSTIGAPAPAANFSWLNPSTGSIFGGGATAATPGALSVLGQWAAAIKAGGKFGDAGTAPTPGVAPVTPAVPATSTGVAPSVVNAAQAHVAAQSGYAAALAAFQQAKQAYDPYASAGADDVPAVANIKSRMVQAQQALQQAQAQLDGSQAAAMNAARTAAPSYDVTDQLTNPDAQQLYGIVQAGLSPGGALEEVNSKGAGNVKNAMALLASQIAALDGKPEATMVVYHMKHALENYKYAVSHVGTPDAFQALREFHMRGGK